MLCETRFFRCDICGNLVGMIHASGAKMICCGQEMTELVPGSVDVSHEKHVPVIKQIGDTVTVHIGSVDHPMTEEHHIGWVYLQTTDGGQRKCLAVGGAPEVTFALGGAKPVAAYAYCNLHGLWKADA
ncbi:MAG TPA: desulfoferrodoxin family protein [Candidatus Cryosericum sp.]|nr:desulfoferrodoxin family protein [Candidatus Cryosericum sp.]